MKIHKEGHTIILGTAVFLAAVNALSLFFLSPVYCWLIFIPSLLLLAFVVRFFREPKREIRQEEGTVFSPADGTVVVVERTMENEFFKEERIQVSVFMSVWNVHINWYPVGGTVEYYKYHPGKFMVAWHPKSSELNERTTTVVSSSRGPVLFRQIAGLVARRIVSYARVGEPAEQNRQCGFIKFGSRVDVFLPLDAEILVKPGDKVTGTRTVLAKMK